MNKLKENNSHDFFNQVASLLKEAKKIVVNNINQTIVLTYFEIGRMIIENEQKGKERAEYGKAVLKELSKRLTSEFGKGYSVYNLERMRKLYLTYKDRIKPDEKSATLLRKSEKIFKLSWSHYLLLLKIDNPDERNFYEIEAATNNWSYRELERQYNSSLYERLVLSMEKKTIKDLSEKGQIISKSTDAVKDPYVLDFLDLEEQKQYTESDLETAIINKLEHFLLELGKGFLFVGRQQRITIEDEHFHVDLVFYNRFLHSFVLIDLKIGKMQKTRFFVSQIIISSSQQTPGTAHPLPI